MKVARRGQLSPDLQPGRYYVQCDSARLTLTLKDCQHYHPSIILSHGPDRQASRYGGDESIWGTAKEPMPSCDSRKPMYHNRHG